ncbi:hypothetical protein ACJX0J_025227, partial [Zea mays]
MSTTLRCWVVVWTDLLPLMFWQLFQQPRMPLIRRWANMAIESPFIYADDMINLRDNIFLHKELGIMKLSCTDITMEMTNLVCPHANATSFLLATNLHHLCYGDKNNLHKMVPWELFTYKKGICDYNHIYVREVYRNVLMLLFLAATLLVAVVVLLVVVLWLLYLLLVAAAVTMLHRTFIIVNLHIQTIQVLNFQHNKQKYYKIHHNRYASGHDTTAHPMKQQ